MKVTHADEVGMWIQVTTSNGIEIDLIENREGELLVQWDEPYWMRPAGYGFRLLPKRDNQEEG